MFWKVMRNVYIVCYRAVFAHTNSYSFCICKIYLPSKGSATVLCCSCYCILLVWMCTLQFRCLTGGHSSHTPLTMTLTVDSSLTNLSCLSWLGLLKIGIRKTLFWPCSEYYSSSTFHFASFPGELSLTAADTPTSHDVRPGASKSSRARGAAISGSPGNGTLPPGTVHLLPYLAFTVP